jgi:hypothetical protein
MPIRSLAPLVLVLGLRGQAVAEVKSVAANSFEVVTTATIAAPPERVYAALGEIGWALKKPVGGGTSLTESYVIGGYYPRQHAAMGTPVRPDARGAAKRLP